MRLGAGKVNLRRARLSPGHTGNNVEATFDFVEATFDFVATNGNKVLSDVDRVERFRLTLRFFDDVSTAS